MCIFSNQQCGLIVPTLCSYWSIKLHWVSEFSISPPLLFRLATDLQLHEYQLHYWKDFPDNCFLQTSESASQIRQVISF